VSNLIYNPVCLSEERVWSFKNPHTPHKVEEPVQGNLYFGKIMNL
jgi:hypothetical protein